ncbi:hypothetical protein [Streptomyces sp. NPDC088258]|uniref:hypothetical protein n=1 Tax=Streptomyces sp. NPDC088258 TaxID=3365849 RepID=UPI0038265BDD
MTARDAAAPVHLGDCFRCDRGGLQVSRVGELIGPYGETPLFACRSCAERLMGMGHHAHETPVRPYVTTPSR